MAKPINLALQGGGAHGAYAWGVLDHLLEDERLNFHAITATSAGALNAACLAYGLHVGGQEGAREKLRALWRAIAPRHGVFGVPDLSMADAIPGFSQMAEVFKHMALGTMQLAASPYQFNPLGLNPLKDALEELIDFDELRKCTKIELFITATNVRTGKARIFTNKDMSVDVLLASACLPNVFRAVEINDEAYWDGGYIGNPSLWPLFYDTDVQDLLVVQLNPLNREDVPKTPADIANRINEISFNSALLKEMRAIAFVQKLVRENWLNDEHKGILSDIRFHAIRADSVVQAFSPGSKYDTTWSFLEELMTMGRTESKRWMDQHYSAIGKKDTVDLHKEFL